jgi:hypothetical protein
VTDRDAQSAEPAAMTRIPVRAERPYEVLVGHGLASGLEPSGLR